MSLIVVDTGVLAEYANIKGRLYREARAVFNRINQGQLDALIVPPAISELHYVMARLYSDVGRKNPGKLAEDYCRYIFHHTGVEVEELSLDLLLDGGRVKETHRLALTDCLALATAKKHHCRALFRHREKEIKEAGEALLREFDIIFLEDYA